MAISSTPAEPAPPPWPLPTAPADGFTHGNLLHALVLSFPIQGHITPLAQLSRRLTRTKGFLVTLVVTDHTAARSPRSPAGRSVARVFPTTAVEQAEDELNSRIRMVSVPDGLPPHYPRDQGFPQQEQAMYGMRRPVELLLHSLQSDASTAVDCIFSDIFVTWSYEMASVFELPLVAVYTGNATSGSVLYHTRMLMSAGILPFKDEDYKDSRVVDCIPGVLPLHPNEFPPSMQFRDINIPRFRFTLRMFEHIHDCVGLLLNTVYEMESKAIDALRGKLPIFAVGPLFLPTTEAEPIPTESEITFWEEEDCMAWLDGKGAATVLYVSFGSIMTYREEQFRELAEGLEESGQPFLWVVRRDAIGGKSLSRALPEGYVERVKGRGMIVSWAPQLRVLGHAAIAGFLTHCGWNSIFESISIGGVPMLCWPDIADQMVNRRLLVDDWKIGLEFRQLAAAGVFVASDEVARVIRQLVLSEDGKGCRERAGKLKLLLRNVVQEGGSSAQSLDELIRILHNRPCVISDSAISFHVARWS